MALSVKNEARLLSHEDRELIGQSHHPAIYDLSREDLTGLKSRLRALRDRERTLLHEKMREARGKGEPRGGSHPGNVEHPARRKQVFAGALKRVNSEIGRLRRIEGRDALTDSARRALAMRRSGQEWQHRPENEPSGNSGPRSTPDKRAKSHIPGSQVGSVSQANKNAQAARDGRGAAA